jgi:hypothetical protein
MPSVRTFCCEECGSANALDEQQTDLVCIVCSSKQQFYLHSPPLSPQAPLSPHDASADSEVSARVPPGPWFQARIPCENQSLIIMFTLRAASSFLNPDITFSAACFRPQVPHLSGGNGDRHKSARGGRCAPQTTQTQHSLGPENQESSCQVDSHPSLVFLYRKGRRACAL